MTNRTKASEFDEVLGLKIKALRNYIGVSGSWLGKKLGVTPQQVMKYENGKNRISSSQLKLIADVFNKPLSYFYENENKGDFIELVEPIDLKTWQNFIKLKSSNHKKAVNNLIKTLLKEE